MLNWKDQQRFWSKVKVAGVNECWEWQAKSRTSGYGFFSAGRKRRFLAHRLAWTIANGEIPKGEGHHGTVVMHTCDNRLCCNPRHLRLGSQTDNVRDMCDKGRNAAAPSLGSKHGNAKFTDQDVIDIRLSGKSDAELAEKYGVTSASVRYARLAGWRHIDVKPVPYPNGKSKATRGANNTNAKLDDEKVRAIRASTEKPGVLARRYGIVPDHVTLIRKRKSWQHVT